MYFRISSSGTDGIYFSPVNLKWLPGDGLGPFFLKVGFANLRRTSVILQPQSNLSCLRLSWKSTRILSMRRSGSAAPHKSWSPTVKAVTYSGPMLSLWIRPIGTESVPGNFSRRKFLNSFFLMIRNNFNPLIGTSQNLFNFFAGDVFLQLNC